MTAAGVYEAVALRYGTVMSTKSDLFLHWSEYGEPDAEQRLDFFFYLLRDGTRTVLVDSGFDPRAAARRGRTCLCPPVEALARAGVAPGDVSHVVVSHFHYDHIGNLDAFPAAEVLVPARELDFWTGPLARRPQFWAHVEAREIDWLRTAGRERVTAFDGRREVLPGIASITVGGHSPGQQIFVVETAAQPLLLASDAVHFYEELALERPFAVIVDLIQVYEAYELIRRVERERGAVVVPGHDPGLGAHFATADGLVYALS